MPTQINRLKQIQENINALKASSTEMANATIRNKKTPALKLKKPATNTTGGYNYNVLAINALKENGYEITQTGFIIDTKSTQPVHITTDEEKNITQSAKVAPPSKTKSNPSNS